MGMGMHDFHGLKTMTFLLVADIAYFWLAVTKVTKYFLPNVTIESFLKTKMKTRKTPDKEHFETLGSKYSWI